MAPAAMMAVAPSHFFRLEAIDFIARRDGGMGIRIGGQLAVAGERLAAQRRGLRAGGKCRSRLRQIQTRVSESAGVP